MAQELTARLAEFTAALRRVTETLDPESGWFAAFARRSGPELTEWLAGRALPPWDAVADLLQDLASRHGAEAAESAARRLRGGYEAAARAQDALPGAHESLTGRLADLDRSERRLRAQQRQLVVAEDDAKRAGQAREAERLAALRMWAQDDEERVVARRAELRARLAALMDRRAAEAASPEPTPPRKPARKPGGARFAGIEEAPPPPAEPPRVPRQAAGPPTAAPPPAAPLPSGSRFAGALRESRREARQGPSQETRPESPRERQERLVAEEYQLALDAVERLRKLRADGQSGVAHVLLSEAAGGPASRMPLLLAELERAGMASDAATLLWEAASLPPGPLAAVAEALAASGRHRDCEQLLRQGAARPAAEAGTIAAELARTGRADEAVTLLTALVRARTAEEAARAATQDPRVVAPLLLDAARRVSPSHHYAITSELRRAGVA
ncbi:hypothetical protein [Streptomyces millisiae]|uniref:UL36 very large tegument protein n=1 Tax=Streptomyces millisiae TaxID=3075542 RepID=A0ABU2LNA6_9ACTN|nr:hypothetical protein [Streptomyces sp. DSM 44918]MDT0319059.1 hypothetical protein [Streptomyces sp. DSM 44918]